MANLDTRLRTEPTVKQLAETPIAVIALTENNQRANVVALDNAGRQLGAFQALQAKFGRSPGFRALADEASRTVIDIKIAESTPNVQPIVVGQVLAEAAKTEADISAFEASHLDRPKPRSGKPQFPTLTPKH